MTDGYEVYDTVAETHQLVHLACWTHCRRHFIDALKSLPKDQRGPHQWAARFIALIGNLLKWRSLRWRHSLQTGFLGQGCVDR